MTDFVRHPLDKLLNRENIFSRVDKLEGNTRANPSASVGQLGQVGTNTGNLIVDGSIVVPNRTDGQADVTIDDNGIYLRNQNGFIGFLSLTGTAIDDVGFYIGSDDFLSFINRINEKGVSFLLYDAASNLATHTITAEGISVAPGSSFFVDDDNPIQDGWFPTTDTITRTGTHSFTVPDDRTGQYRKGAKFAYTDAAANEYGVVGTSSYASSDTFTTVNLITNTDYSMSTDAIASPSLSYIENPLSFPQWFNFDAAPTGFASTDVPPSPSYRWHAHANTIFISYVEPTNGTSNATTFTASAPIAPIQNVTAVAGTLVDNGALLTVAGRVTMTAGSVTMTFRTNMSTGAWTAANGKRALVEFFYEF